MPGIASSGPIRNETYASTTDPEARLLRKGPGQETRLAFLGHSLMDFTVSLATGTADRERGYRPRTLGADRSVPTPKPVRPPGR